MLVVLRLRIVSCLLLLGLGLGMLGVQVRAQTAPPPEPQAPPPLEGPAIGVERCRRPSCPAVERASGKTGHAKRPANDLRPPRLLRVAAESTSRRHRRNRSPSDLPATGPA